MASVSELVSALDVELVRLGYKPSTMVWYRGCWRRLERYFASRGVQEFSLNVAMAWVDEACGGFFEKEQAGTLKATDAYLFRVAAMLDDFAVHGSVLRRYSRSVSKLSAEQADVLARFRAWLGAEGCAVSTVRAYGMVVGEFLAFTGARGGLGGLDGGVVGAFVVTLAGYQSKTVEHKLCAVRSLLRFAAADGLIDEAVLGTVPSARSVRRSRVPSVWDPVDVAKVLEAIDRGNPSGKRDYAIVLLICRLGLRAVDVTRLRFADLDWPGNQLSVVQAKTGRRVDLPLLKDVGWAVTSTGVSEEPCKRGRKDKPCLRELTAGSIKKMLSARSEATLDPPGGERCFPGCRAVLDSMRSRWSSATSCWTRCFRARGRLRRSRARTGCWGSSRAGC